METTRDISNNENKLKIAMLILATSKNRDAWANIKDSYLYKMTLKSFLLTLDKEHEYIFYVGIDKDDRIFDKSEEQELLDSNKVNSTDYPFPPQKKYPDIPKPRNSELLKKGQTYDTQLSDLSDYVEYLEKMVVDYKKYIEERFDKVNNQKLRVVENFEMGGKNTNDLLIYIITCVFVLLLVDY